MTFQKPRDLFYKAGRQLIQGVDYADHKLIRLSMKLMALKTQAPAPIHPKNIGQRQLEFGWFDQVITGDSLQVLDLGAGSGSLSVASAQRGARVVALEGDSTSIQVINDQRAKLANPSLVEPFRHDLEATPYPVASGQFDVVYSFNVIEHLHNRKGHLQEIIRALKPGGKLVITGPNRSTAWKKLRGHFGLSMLADEDHKIEYTREEFLAELASVGLTEILFEELTVVDAPINGLLDLLGPVSIELWRKSAEFKAWLARRFPSETTGFLLILRK